MRASTEALWTSLRDPVGEILNAPKDPKAPSDETILKLRTIETFRTLGVADTALFSASGAEHFERALARLEATRERLLGGGRNLRRHIEGQLASGPAARLMLTWALGLAHQSQARGSSRPEERIVRTLAAISDRVRIQPEQRQEIAALLTTWLNSLTANARLEQLERIEIRKGLPREVLLAQLESVIIEARRSGQPSEDTWQRLTHAIGFDRDEHELGLELRNRVARRLQTQPIKDNQELAIQRPTDAEAAKRHAITLRLWSGTSALIHTQNFRGQIEALDYILGRTERVPDFLRTLDARDYGQSGVLARAEELRAELSVAPDHVRAFFAHSVLEGPAAKISAPAHRRELLEYLMSFVEPAKREVASDVISAMIEAEGPRAIALLGEILGKREINEASMIEIGLKNYFVAGMKFGQYLAFTGQFRHLEPLLAQFQDSAPVPGYYDIMTYLSEVLGPDVDRSKIFVTRLLGAGTVNLGLEFIDLRTNETKVIHLPRERIKERSDADFRRFGAFAERLAARSRPGYDYGFVSGLVGLIRRSIQLEFDRVATVERQNEAFAIYAGMNIGDWRLQSVRAERRIGDAIIMGKAPGITAKKLWETDRALYRRLMGGLYDVEFERIFKLTEPSGTPRSLRLANPDLHDGQVLIDRDSRTVTVIDFGQSLPITDAQLQTGLEFLAVLTGVTPKTRALEFVNQWIARSGSPRTLTQAEFQNIFANPDPMDRFVRLTSRLELSRAPLPLEIVHLILQINRLSKLGHKVGRFPKVAIGYQLITRELLKRRSATQASSPPADQSDPSGLDRPHPNQRTGSVGSCRDIFSSASAR